MAAHLSFNLGAFVALCLQRSQRLLTISSGSSLNGIGFPSACVIQWQRQHNVSILAAHATAAAAATVSSSKQDDYFGGLVGIGVAVLASAINEDSAKCSGDEDDVVCIHSIHGVAHYNRKTIANNNTILFLNNRLMS